MQKPIMASIYGLNLSVFILMINSWYWANCSHMILCIFMSSNWNKFMDSSRILSNIVIISVYSYVSWTSTRFPLLSSFFCFVFEFRMICLSICLNYLIFYGYISSFHSLISLLMKSGSTMSNPSSSSSSTPYSSSSEYPSLTPSSFIW